MKKLLIAFMFTIALQVVFAQSNWKLSGNSGISASDFLGTTDNKHLVFKTNDTERGRLTSAGLWRFGLPPNYTQVDASGNLSFNGSASYLVNANSYIFRYSGNNNYGLYFNSGVPRYEFRNGSATPVFYVNANNGNGVFNGTLKVGAYTLPSIDGLSGQVLKTNGSGLLAWSNDLNSGGGGANVFLSNLSSPTAINQSLLPGVTNLIDLGSSSFSWKDIYTNGSLYLSGQKFLSNPGNRCIQIGNNALLSNTVTGEGNMAIGEQALTANTTGLWNSATGFQTLYSNIDGNYNNAYGFQALALNTSGSDNDAYGTITLFHNTTGVGNSAFGGSALLWNSTGNSNVGVGVQALLNNSIGSYNVAIGLNSVGRNTEGSSNTGVGYYALGYTTTGLGNTAIGNYTLETNETGNYNTVLGSNSDVTAIDLSNATVIGANAVVDASDKVRIGNTTVTSIGGEVGWTTFSDGRYKKNIKENVPGLEFINSLRPITYTVDVNELNNHYNKNIKTPGDITNAKSKELFSKSSEQASKIIYTGFVAQDVEAAAKKLNYDFSGVDKPKSNDGLYGLRYDEFVVPLVKAVQEISNTNDSLHNQITDLQNQLNEIKNQLAGLVKGSVSVSSTILTSARLEQNMPNPFNQTTQINYFIPPSAANAMIKVTGMKGETIKTVSLNTKGSGQLTLETAQLSSGTYTYSLYVDGNLIDSKKMVVVK